MSTQEPIFTLVETTPALCNLLTMLRRTNSNDPYATNSVLSGKVNTNVGGVVVNPPSVINKTGVTTVPYNASGVYSPGVASTGYVAAVPNRGTQEVRQTVTTTAPNYAYE